MCTSKEDKYQSLSNIYGAISIGQSMIFCHVSKSKYSLYFTLLLSFITKYITFSKMFDSKVLKHIIYYCPPTKLWEGNVFSLVSLSVHGVVHIRSCDYTWILFKLVHLKDPPLA